MTSGPTRTDRIGGILMVGAMLVSIPYEFTGHAVFARGAALCTILSLAAFAPRVGWSRRVFLLIGLSLAALAVARLPDWREAVTLALSRASFIAAFFTALTAIRSAAISDPGIVGCGRFLAGQPPGRRYFALTLGGHLFGLLLMYGSISLLGALAADSTRGEADAEIRGHKTRRMLVAIQRGFISTLPWSPLAFASAITLTLVPGAQWAAAVPLCLVSAALLAGLGWALDTIFKPKLSGPAPPQQPAEGHWFAHLRPLFLLLGILVISVSLLHFSAGIRIVGAVTAIVPAIALIWTASQPEARGRRLLHTGRKAKAFATDELPALRGELVLLVMAGFIGTMGSHLLLPIMSGAGWDMTAIPPPLLLVGLFWIIPVTGQLGMNPILAVSLLAPLVPSPDQLGVPPAIVVTAITSGWALSGATSPFTASVLLVGAYGEVSASHVGLRWNGLYAVCCGVALSLWIAILALFAG